MKGTYKYGIGFWLGVGILSLINMIMNLKHVNHILIYNYLMIGISIFGVILNMVLLKRHKTI